MKKKIIISILIAVLLIFGLWKLIFYISNKDLIDKGNNLYGREKCECDLRALRFSGICSICGTESYLSGIGFEENKIIIYGVICNDCSEITNRCMKCGGLDPCEEEIS